MNYESQSVCAVRRYNLLSFTKISQRGSFLVSFTVYDFTRKVKGEQ